MRLSLLLLAILAGTVALGGRAEAQNYPWCAIYSMADPPANCGFVSYDQCMATVSGIGGFCMTNNEYQPAGPGLGPSRRRAKHSPHGQS